MNDKSQNEILFVSDMEVILDYFGFNFKNPDAASRFLDQVETAIRKRSNYPEAFEPYDGRAMAGKYPYYWIYVENYTIYYVVGGPKLEMLHGGTILGNGIYCELCKAAIYTDGD